MKRTAAILAVAIGVLASSGAGKADEPVFWKQFSGSDIPNSGELTKEPKQLFVYKRNSAGALCSGCGWRLVNLKWENWGGTRAIGRGNAVPIGGPGTCGYPPEGCHYPYKEADVYLKGIAGYCGQRRYMRVATIVDGFGDQYPKVNCEGQYLVKTNPITRP